MHAQFRIHNSVLSVAHFAGARWVIDRSGVVARPIKGGVIVVDIQIRVGAVFLGNLTGKWRVFGDCTGDVHACHNRAAIGFSGQIVWNDLGIELPIAFTMMSGRVIGNWLEDFGNYRSGNTIIKQAVIGGDV